MHLSELAKAVNLKRVVIDAAGILKIVFKQLLVRKQPSQIKQGAAVDDFNLRAKHTNQQIGIAGTPGGNLGKFVSRHKRASAQRSKQKGQAFAAVIALWPHWGVG